MLTIKMGVAIHADYTFWVKSTDPTRNKGPFVFVNNELTEAGLDQHGKDIVIGNAVFGTSSAEAEDFSGVLVPVRKQSIANVIPINSSSADAVKKTFNIKSTAQFLVGEFDLRGESTLAIREFGIENYNRIVLEDPFQELHGLIVGPGDRIEVKVEFNYTYYTNNKIGTLGEDVFGDRVDYTSEVVKLRDQALAAVRQNPGYASENPIDVFPIIKDMRTTQSALLDFPIRDEFQQEKNVLDDKVHRLDAHVIGYYPQRTTVYGFILRDNVRGMGVLVRFLKPVSFAPERRYEAFGYIQWGRVIDDIDDGFTTVDLDPVSEVVDIQTNTTGEVTVVEPIDDVAIQITSLSKLKLTLDSLGVVVDLPNNITWGEAFDRLTATGLFDQVELLANRVGARRASLFQYYPPDALAHDASVGFIKTQLNQTPFIYPSLVAGGDYTNTSISNKWRWDCYFPFFGDLPGVSYVPYGFAAFADSYDTINGLPLAIKDNETLTQFTRRGDATDVDIDYTGKMLIDRRVNAGPTPGLVSFFTYPVESANSKQIIAKMVSDFDTPNYDDWVEGTTEVTVNLRTLDLRSEVVSDNRKDVTELRIVIDSTRHKAENAQLWVGKVSYGRLDQVTPAQLALIGIKLVVSTVSATKTAYTFTRPYAVDVTAFADLYIIGNEKIFSTTTREVGYLTLVTGSHGFKVYNSSGSDVSNSLYPEDNPFLMAGVKLFQPTPDYIFKYTNLTAQQAAIYFNDPSITTTLPGSMFTTGFNDFEYGVDYNGELSWKSELLNGPRYFPAIGVDLTRIGDNIPDTTVLVADSTGKQWTKAQLLNSRIATPNRVINDVLYFVTPFKLIEGNQQLVDNLDSVYYDQHINLRATIITSLTYPLESAEIQPNPINVIVGRTQQATYTYFPTQATITSADWSVINEGIASVNEFGLVSGNAPGTTTLRLVLNGRVIATAVVNVSDADLNISCDGAANITPCMDINGTQLGLSINDVETLPSVTGQATYEYFRDTDDFRIVNCQTYKVPAETPVSETNFLDLDGTYDLWVDGSLIAKNLTEAEIIARLTADGRLMIIDGENNV